MWHSAELNHFAAQLSSSAGTERFHDQNTLTYDTLLSSKKSWTEADRTGRCPACCGPRNRPLPSLAQSCAARCAFDVISRHCKEWQWVLSLSPKKSPFRCNMRCHSACIAPALLQLCSHGLPPCIRVFEQKLIDNLQAQAVSSSLERKSVLQGCMKWPQNGSASRKLACICTMESAEWYAGC